MRAASARFFSGKNPLQMPSEDQVSDDDFIDVFNEDYITGCVGWCFLFVWLLLAVVFFARFPPPLVLFISHKTNSKNCSIEGFTDGIIYPNMANSVEWVLSSPPPLHCFHEPPIMVDCQDDTECEWINPTA